MLTTRQVKARILDIVSSAPDLRIRPIDLERTILKEGESSKQTIKQALNALMQAKRLVYTYRDPCSYVEIPAVESHQSS